MADHDGEVIHLAMLAGEDGVISNQSFERCDIKGPAVLIAINDSVIEHNRIDGGDAALWEVPADRVGFIGAVVADGCRFTGCHFMNVGFAGPPEFIARLKGE